MLYVIKAAVCALSAAKQNVFAAGMGFFATEVAVFCGHNYK